MAILKLIAGLEYLLWEYLLRTREPVAVDTARFKYTNERKTARYIIIILNLLANSFGCLYSLKILCI